MAKRFLSAFGLAIIAGPAAWLAAMISDFKEGQAQVIGIGVFLLVSVLGFVTAGLSGDAGKNKKALAGSWVAILGIFAGAYYLMYGSGSGYHATKSTGYLVVTQDTALCPLTEADYKEFAVLKTQGDNKAVLAMATAGKMLALKKGTRCEYLDGAVGYRKVKVADGDLAGRECLLVTGDFAEERR